MHKCISDIHMVPNKQKTYKTKQLLNCELLQIYSKKLKRKTSRGP